LVLSSSSHGYGLEQVRAHADVASGDRVGLFSSNESSRMRILNKQVRETIADEPA